MKKLNFWGFLKLSITIIKLWKDHRAQLQVIFEELESIIKGIRKGTYSNADISVIKQVRSNDNLINRRVRMA